MTIMTLRLLFGSIILAAAAALAACSSGPTYTAPTPGPTCSPGTTVQMIYPIPGATGVPDAPQQIAFAVASPLPNSWNLFLNVTDTLGATGYQGFTGAGFETIAAGQVPSPSATPSFSNATYQSVTLGGALASKTTYWVWINNQATNCTPNGPVGSFTTE